MRCSFKTYVQFTPPESAKLLGTLKGHRSHIHSISVHPSGGSILTCSQESSLLFDMQTFTRKRSLNGASVVGLSQALFEPSGHHVFTGKLESAHRFAFIHRLIL